MEIREDDWTSEHEERPSLEDYPGVIGDALRRIIAEQRAQIAQGQVLGLVIDTQREHRQQFHAELAELRDGLVDLDHRLADLQREHAATRQVLNSLQEDGA